MRKLYRFVVTAAMTGSLIATASVSLHATPIIGKVEKIAGNATPINLLTFGLKEGVEAYSDRTHKLVNIPPVLVDGDFVQVSNSDKQSNPYQVDVTMARDGVLYVGLDDRYAQPKPWMDDTSKTGLPAKFFNTGAKMDIDESADGDIDQHFTLWAALAPAGTYHLLENLTDGNNYTISADTKVVPEPGSMVLVALGLAGVAGLVRRHQRA